MRKSRETEIAVQKPDHKAFVVPGPDFYYIGFEDMTPGSLGEHLKNNMAGLWFPPYRIISNIYVVKEGRNAKAESMTARRDGRIFDFGFCTMIVSAPEDDRGYSLQIDIPEVTGKLRIIMEKDVIPVWGITENYHEVGRADGGKILVSVIPVGETIEFSSDGNCSLKLEDGKVSATVNGKARVNIRRLRPGNTGTDNGSYNSATEERETVLSSTLDLIGVAIHWSEVNLKWLYHEYGEHIRCIAAGQPEFPWFFSIDTFLSLEGMLSAGLFRLSRNSLETLFRLAEEKRGRMPHEFLHNGWISNPGNVEETAYMPIALDQYYRWTGDGKFVSRHFNTALTGLISLASGGIDGKAVMEDHQAGEGTDIDSMCYFVKAADSILSLEKTLELDTGADGELIADRAWYWKKFIRKEMWMPEEDAYADRCIDGVPVMKGFWTTILPFEQGIAPREKYQRFTEGHHFNDLMLEDGLRVDRNGIVMPVNTGLLVKASLKYGDRDNAWKLYLKNMNTFGRYSTAAFPEMSNDKRGCFIQAWSSALMIENMITGFLGIRPNGNDVVANPMIPESIRGSTFELTGLRTWNSRYDLKFDHSGVEISKSRVPI